MKKGSVQIWILSRDRRDYFRQTLDSVLAQDHPAVDIVVSDNSEGDEVEALMREHYPAVRYIRRRPALSALAHFRTVIEESAGDYVVFFHDDDIMRPNYVSGMLSTFAKHPHAAAVGCNATVIRGEQRTPALYMGRAPGERILGGTDDLLHPYLGMLGPRPPAFPGYMYRRRHLDGLYLDPKHGGKYSDVSFLMKVVARGPIVWINRPLIEYRLHAGNDSAHEAVGQRLRLLRYVYRHSSLAPRSALVDEYRFRYWFRWWRSARGAAAHPGAHWRKPIVQRFLVSRAVGFIVSRPSLWKRSLSKVF